MGDIRKYKCLVSEAMVTSTWSENHENYGFSGLPKVESKSYYSKMKQNNSTQLLGHSFFEICSKNGPQAPPDPKSSFFPDFLGFSSENVSDNIFVKDRRIVLKEFCCDPGQNGASEGPEVVLEISWNFE